MVTERGANPEALGWRREGKGELRAFSSIAWCSARGPALLQHPREGTCGSAKADPSLSNGRARGQHLSLQLHRDGEHREALLNPQLRRNVAIRAILLPPRQQRLPLAEAASAQLE